MLVSSVWGAERIHWYGHYDTALRAARLAHKPLLVVLVQPRRREGAELIRAVAEDSRLRHAIASRYVAVIVTADTHASYPIELYYTTRYPAVFFSDAGEEIPRGEPCVAPRVFSCLQQRIRFGKPTNEPALP
jgi:hypothetical protein